MRRAALAAAAPLLAAVGCAGSAIGTAELPTAPIAVQWRDAAAARKYAEFEEAREQGGVPRGRTPGVADVADIGDYLRYAAGVAPRGPSEAEAAARLALIDPRTGAVTPIESALPDALPVAWVEPGRRLLFSQFDGGLRQLFVLDLERGEVRQLTRGQRAHARGCLLPDGSVVASSAGVESPTRGAPARIVSRIVVYRGGRPEPEPLSDGPADHSPACAPDGHAVVWVTRGPKGREDLVSRAPLEAEPHPIGPGRDPSFSRDGAWVVYASPVGRSFRLQRVRPDGSGRVAIGQSDLEEREPAFGPDGRLVVYVVHEGYERRLDVRRIDGSGDRILFADGGAEHPVW